MDFISRFMEQHRLPESFRVVARDHYEPFCAGLCEIIKEHKGGSPKPFLLGINGAQGTGKSTLADFVAEYFCRAVEKEHKCRIAVLSIDDFYLTKAQRIELSKTVHPLLKTRGVPGTHDLPLAMDVINRLLAKESEVALPRFDKAMDDRASTLVWPVMSEPVDVIIFEGWCVGSVPENQSRLKQPINELEEEQDADGAWRQYVNESLSRDYQPLFDLIDYLVLLKAPDFDSVFRWRSEQEEKLAEKIGYDAPGLMSKEQIASFIQHYERLTRHNLQTLPNKANKQFSLNQDHLITKTKLRRRRSDL